jgi:Fe-S-cluster-containing dehydrogenase component
VTGAFLLDVETCVGCHACVVACTNENGLAPGRSWRRVVTFNPDRLPGLPVFHLSVACHHCLDAPCLRQCPAAAIRRDAHTGAVLIDEGRCVGCRYCSWVCPYDAPVFDDGSGVMRKCTWCVHRLVERLLPACVGSCPVGALRLEEHGSAAGWQPPGFPDRASRPAIRFESPRARATSAPAGVGAGAATTARTADATAGPGGAAAHAGGAAVAVGEGRPAGDVQPAAMPDIVPAGAPPRISFRAEWPLAVFTFVAEVLTGVAVGMVLGGPRVPWWAFAGAGVLGALIAAAHLGRPDRAWRAALNWRTSWLSREVLSYAMFVAAGSIAAMRSAGSRWDLPAAACGVACLFAIDRVYGATARRRPRRLDAGAAVSSGLFLAGVLAGEPWLWGPAGAVRVLAWLRVTTRARVAASGIRAALLLRPLVGWLLPLAIWRSGDAAWGPLAVLGALAGEWLDRCAFYDDLDPLSPQQSMADALARAMARLPP